MLISGHAPCNVDCTIDWRPYGTYIRSSIYDCTHALISADNCMKYFAGWLLSLIRLVPNKNWLSFHSSCALPARPTHSRQWWVAGTAWTLPTVSKWDGYRIMLSPIARSVHVCSGLASEDTIAGIIRQHYQLSNLFYFSLRFTTWHHVGIVAGFSVDRVQVSTVTFRMNFCRKLVFARTATAN